MISTLSTSFKISNILDEKFVSLIKFLIVWNAPGLRRFANLGRSIFMGEFWISLSAANSISVSIEINFYIKES